MRRVRSIWSCRLIAAVFLTSLLPMFVAPPAGGWAANTLSTHADWLLSQTRQQPDPVFLTALEKAAAEAQSSRIDFLTTFIEAFEALKPEASLSKYFTTASLSNEALLALLEGRSINLRVEPVAIPITLRGSAFQSCLMSGDRSSTPFVDASPSTDIRPNQWSNASPDVVHVIHPVLLLTSQQPLGP